MNARAHWRLHHRQSHLAPLRARAELLLVGLLALGGACFNSDEKFRQSGTTSTTGATTSTTAPDPTTETTTTVGSTGEPDVTCRDAIDCIFECAAAVQAKLQMDPDYEPDLSCFLDCEEKLTVQEAYKLLKLGNCASMVCSDLGACMPPDDTTGGGSSSSDGGSSSSGGSSGSSGSSSSDGGGGGGSVIDPCIDCIFVHMLDPESPGCQEFAMDCD